MIFLYITKTNLAIWTTESDCPSKIKVGNESSATEVVEGEECLLSKLCLRPGRPVGAVSGRQVGSGKALVR